MGVTAVTLLPPIQLEVIGRSNGRAENEIGIVKRHAKVLMKAHNVAEELWPILVRHAGERRLRWQLQQVGYPVPELLPFNTKVFVKKEVLERTLCSMEMGTCPWLHHGT